MQRDNSFRITYFDLIVIFVFGAKDAMTQFMCIIKFKNVLLISN